MLGISERAVRQRISRGQLPYRRWGCRLVILPDELEAFLNALPGLSSEDAVARVAGK